MRRRHRLRTLVCLSVVLLTGTLYRALENLRFLHLSDSHVPHALAQTRSTLGQMPLGGPAEMTPWGICISFGRLAQLVVPEGPVK